MPGAIVSFAIVLVVVDVVLLAFAAGWLRRTGQTYALKHSGARNALETLRQIHDLTSNVAGRVEDHLARVESLSQELNALRGSLSGSAETAVVDAVSRVVAMNRDLSGQLAEARRKMARQAETIAEQAASARADLVTGLPNRRGFDDEFGRRFAQWQEQQVPLSLVMIEIDQLQAVTAKHGPEAGDELLRIVGQRLADTMRAMDLIARFAADQFAMLLPGTTLDQACSAVERFRAEIAAQPYVIGGEAQAITIREGVAEAMPGDDIRSLMRRTLAALAAAVGVGQNCAFSHDGQSTQAITDERQPGPIASGLHRDLLRLAGQFKIEPAGPYSDPLTGLSNRRLFFDTLRKRTGECSVRKTPLTLALVDVDAMHQLNHAHGHLIGDMVLRIVAQIVRTATRGDCDLAARYEGSKFAVVLSSMSAVEALDVAERISRAVAACKLSAERREMKVTVTVGLAEWSPGTDAVGLIKSAEAALKVAKAGSRRIHVGPGSTPAPSNKSRRPDIAAPPMPLLLPPSAERAIG